MITNDVSDEAIVSTQIIPHPTAASDSLLEGFQCVCVLAMNGLEASLLYSINRSYANTHT